MNARFDLTNRWLGRAADVVFSLMVVLLLATRRLRGDDKIKAEDVRRSIENSVRAFLLAEQVENGSFPQLARSIEAASPRFVPLPCSTRGSTPSIRG